MTVNWLIMSSWVIFIMKRLYIKRHVSVDLRHSFLLSKSNAVTWDITQVKWNRVQNSNFSWLMIQSNCWRFLMAYPYSRFTMLSSQKFWRWIGSNQECKFIRMKHFSLLECTKIIFLNVSSFLFSPITFYMESLTLTIITNTQTSKRTAQFSKLMMY